MEKNNKFYNFSYKFICIFVLIILVLISIGAIIKTAYFKATFDYALEFSDYKYDNVFLNILFVIILAFLVFLISYLLNKIKPKIAFVLFLVGLIVFLSFAIHFILDLSLQPHADQGQIMILGNAIAHEKLIDHMSPGSYLDMFRYQYGISMYIGLVIRIFDVISNFKMTNYYIYLQILNAVYSFLILLIMWYIGYLIFDKDKKKSIYLGIVLLLFSVYLVFFNIQIYGNIVGLLFVLLAILCLVKYFENKNIVFAIFSGILISGAVEFKTNYQIIFIAMTICLGLELIQNFKTLKDKKDKILKTLAVVCFLICYFLIRLLDKGLFYRYVKDDINGGIPMITFIYMSWAPGNTLSSGWYTGDVINIYTDSGFDEEKTKEETLKRFDARINEFKENPKEFRRYLWDKLESTWLNPTFQTMWTATPGYERIDENYEKRIEENHLEYLKDLLSYDKGLYQGFERYFETISTFIFVFAIVGIIVIIKEKDIRFLVFPLSFLGGAMFHFMWETKAIYVFCYYFMILIISIIGFDKVVELIKNKISKDKVN